MVELLDTDTLFVTTLDRREASAGSPGCSVLDTDGGLVARVVDVAGGGRRLARGVGLLTRSSAFEWDVVDGDGRRLLHLSKPARRGPRPEVTLADGRPVGRALPGRGGLPRVSLRSADDRDLGALEPALGERRARPVLVYRLEVGGASQGEVLRETRDGWGYHLRFTGADAAARALTLAYVVCLLQQQTGLAAL